jgi:hypothetical protein
MSKDEFEIYVNNEICYNSCGIKGPISDISKSNYKILDGYAPFCKMVAIKNPTDAKVGSLPITLENYQYLRSGYSTRRDDELPVLSRWFELPLGVPKAEWLMLVLYNKEQINKELELEDEKNEVIFKSDPFDADWGIVAILGQSHENDEPMSPITVIRNAYMYGGSGVKFDEEYYLKSVDFWSMNAVVK